MRRSTLLVLLLAFAGQSAACDGCREADRPVLPALPAAEQTQPVTADDAEGSAAPPPRPVIVHDEPPTLDAFEVEPVTGDWVTFRGASHRSGYRDVRSIASPRVRWAVSVGVQGYANSPIVTGDAIYVASQGEHHNMADPRDGVYKLDPATGAVQWHFKTDNDANGSLLLGTLLVVGGDQRTLIGIDVTTGRERWRIEQECQIYHVPALHDGKLAWIRRDTAGGLMRVDPESGTVEGDQDCYRSERGATSAGGGQLFRGADERLSMHDALGLAWQTGPLFDQHGARGRWTPPLLTRDIVIDAVHRHPFDVDGAGALDFRPAATAYWRDNGQAVWTIDINDPARANREQDDTETPFLRTMPWVRGGRLFWTPTNAGKLVAYDVVSGDRLDEVDFPDCRKRAFGSIVGTSELGYYARHDGVLYAFRQEPLAIAWQLSLGQHGTAGAARTHHPVRGPCFAEPRDGTALFSAPAIGEDGTLYVGSGDGWLYAIVDVAW